MIILYIIGILCSLVLFAPNFIPFFVKWPVALVVALLMVFFFNLPKKDTFYTTHDNKKRLYDFGLYNPLVIYVAASSYILGFNMIFSFLIEKEALDIVANIATIPSLITFDFTNNLFVGLILVVAGILLYVLRNAFRAGASKSGLKCRSFWYIVFTLLALGAGVYSYMSFATFDVYEQLKVGNNIFVYFGLAGLVILIDLICLIIAAIKRKKAERLEAELLVLAEENGGEPLTKEQILAYKRSKVVERERLRTERKLAKKEARINKRLAKIEARKAKEIERTNKKLAELNQ